MLLSTCTLKLFCPPDELFSHYVISLLIPGIRLTFYMWPTIHTKTGLGKNPNIVSDCTSTFGYAQLQITFSHPASNHLPLPTPCWFPLLEMPQQVEQVSKGVWGLTEIMSQRCWRRPSLGFGHQGHSHALFPSAARPSAEPHSLRGAWTHCWTSGQTGSLHDSGYCP